jgi:activator of HSP90 ATPase
MMGEKLEMSVVLPASARRLFESWINSQDHSAFTGSPAEIDPQVGGKFRAWDGYISGQTVVLEPNRRIVQTWRTSEFPEQAPDSTLEILLDEEEDGTRLTLLHTNIPEGQAEQYEQGWRDYYFTPMLEYFKVNE